jgi:hypothetical protein
LAGQPIEGFAAETIVIVVGRVHFLRSRLMFVNLTIAIYSNKTITNDPGTIRGHIKRCVKSASGAARFLLLNGWAFDRAKGAEHAAIPGIWFEQRSTALALIEKLAGIGWHYFRFGMSATWAGEG